MAAIRKELRHADIPESLLEGNAYRGLPTRICGKLGDITFIRFPDHWEVIGPVPLALANEFWHNERYGHHIMVSEGIQGEDPNEVALPTEENIRNYLEGVGEETINLTRLRILSKQGVIKGERFVHLFRIDTIPALIYFVFKLREAGK